MKDRNGGGHEPPRRHSPREGNGAPAGPEELPGDIELIDTVQERIERWLGPIAAVWCLPRIEDEVHVDLHWVPPTTAHPWHWVLTTGMAERPMEAPEGGEECRFAELYICLPPDWPMAMEMDLDGPGWPLRLLTQMAQFPHATGRWMWYAHTFASVPLEPFSPRTELSSAILGPSISMPRGFNGIPVGEDRTVWYFSVLPLYPEERALALRASGELLLRLFRKTGVDDLVREDRGNVVASLLGRSR